MLKNAKAGDDSSLEEMSFKLKPGLTTITQSTLPAIAEEERNRIVQGTIDEFKERLNEIRQSPSGYARALLKSQIMNRLLRDAKNEDSFALNELLRLLHVRIHEDPQFSSKGWGSELDSDLLQDSFEVFIQKLDNVKDNPYNYFKQIVRYKIQDKINARKRMRERIDDSVHESSFNDEKGSSHGGFENIPYDDTFTERVEDRDTLDLTIKAINQLSEFCSKFFKAIINNQDEKLWRITAMLDFQMSESALNTRIHRCRHSLKKLVKEQGLI